LLPVLARTRHQPDRYRRAYTLFVQAIATCAIPGIMAAAIASDEVVTLLLGDRWRAAGPIFAWLAATSALLIVNEAAPWILMSTNRSHRMMYWGLFASATVVMSFAIGVYWGAIGVAIAYFVGELLRSPILFLIATRGTPVRPLDLARVHIVTILSVSACLLVRQWILDSMPSAARIVVLMLVSYVAAAAAQFLSPQGRELMSLASAFVKKQISLKLSNPEQ
jgi:PST family polysaccharide transporter